MILKREEYGDGLTNCGIGANGVGSQDHNLSGIENKHSNSIITFAIGPQTKFIDQEEKPKKLKIDLNQT